jgi:hypothetical protein
MERDLDPNLAPIEVVPQGFRPVLKVSTHDLGGEVATAGTHMWMGGTRQR